MRSGYGWVFVGALLLTASMISVQARTDHAQPAHAASVIGPKATSMKSSEHYRGVFHDAHGKVIDQKTFMQRAHAGQRFKMAPDPAKHVMNLTLYPPGKNPKDAGFLGKGPSKPTIRPGQHLPAFALHTTAGRPVSEATLRGRPTLMNFFFAECEPCIAEIPALDAYAKQHPKIRVLALTFDDVATAKTFVAKKRFTWPVIYAGQTLLDRIGVKAYPTLALFDAEGRLIGTHLSTGLASGKKDIPSPQDIDHWVTTELASAHPNSAH